MTGRTGWDIIADLQDAPNSLHNLAYFNRPATFPETGDEDTIGQDDLHRWADAIQEFLDGTSGAARWKAYAMLGACAAVGFFAGVVTMMVLTR